MLLASAWCVPVSQSQITTTYYFRVFCLVLKVVQTRRVEVTKIPYLLLILPYLGFQFFHFDVSQRPIVLNPFRSFSETWDVEVVEKTRALRVGPTSLLGSGIGLLQNNGVYDT